MAHSTKSVARPTKTLSNSIGLASVTLSTGKNYVFFYNEDNQISSISGTDNDTAYSETTVTIPPSGASIAQNHVSPLAATAWTNDDGTLEEIRLYYVDAGNYIKELASADGVKWRSGAFSDKSFQIASYGGLSASFGSNQGLKVFFVDATSGKFTEAYINTTIQAWTSKILV